MITFENDYSYGCHPRVLQKLIDTNMEAQIGYGFDEHSIAAAKLIREACQLPDADVFFLAGGTQTNQIVIDSLLPSWAAVAAADTGHIACHESGAIEFTGHKVLTLPAHDGKVNAGELDAYVERAKAENGVGQILIPAVVYISFPTEYGTLYSLSELRELRRVCDKHDLKLYCDGARLGYGLAAPENDVTLPQLAGLCDVFYIGGTKVGALCGEAVVFHHDCTPRYFINTLKQHGGMFAKGRLCSTQFEALFTDNLYMEISKHAMDMAELLKNCLTSHGIRLSPASPTNQQFAVLTREMYEKISESVRCCYWGPEETGSDIVVRFCTSWATQPEEIEYLGKVLEQLS